jgi:hypothetical protein
MKVLRAWWLCSSSFDIPSDVAEYLLPEPYGPDTEAVGRWYIRYNTLYYNDKEGRTQEIEGSEILADYGSCKIPHSITDEEGEEVYKDD